MLGVVVELIARDMHMRALILALSESGSHYLRMQGDMWTSALV